MYYYPVRVRSVLVSIHDSESDITQYVVVVRWRASLAGCPPAGAPSRCSALAGLLALAQGTRDVSDAPAEADAVLVLATKLLHEPLCER